MSEQNTVQINQKGYINIRLITLNSENRKIPLIIFQHKTKKQFLEKIIIKKNSCLALS